MIKKHETTEITPNSHNLSIGMIVQIPNGKIETENPAVGLEDPLNRRWTYRRHNCIFLPWPRRGEPTDYKSTELIHTYKYNS